VGSPTAPVRLRVSAFSSDAYGLAHAMRNARVIRRLTRERQDVAALLINGVGHSVAVPVDRRTDVLSLPVVRREPGAGHTAPGLELPFEDVRRLRSRVLCTALGALRPDLALFDHLSLNVMAEIEEAVAGAAPSGPRVLAFNDILNHPDVVRRNWYETGALDFAAEHFDEVWIYGDERFYSWADHYPMPESFAAKLRYTGFLSDEFSPHAEAEQRRQVRDQLEIPAEARVLLVTGGGGHDADEMYRRVVTAAGRLGPDTCTIVLTGPMLSPRDHQELQAMGPAGVRLVRYHPEFAAFLAASDVVASMGGCTLTEVLVARRPLVVFPRHRWASSQQIRTELLEKHGFARLAPADDDRLVSLLDSLLAEPTARRLPRDWRFDGLAWTTRRMSGLLPPGVP
jgi:predicted glycosyltransferase